MIVNLVTVRGTRIDMLVLLDCTFKLNYTAVWSSYYFQANPKLLLGNLAKVVLAIFFQGFTFYIDCVAILFRN